MKKVAKMIVMKTLKTILLVGATAVISIQAYRNNSVPEMEKVNMHSEFSTPLDTNINVDTKGYQGNGEIVAEFDCPDSRFFPPIDLKNWEKTPVVNGRLPTYEETITGVSIHTYGGRSNPDVKPYNMTLPKLAYIQNPYTKLEEVVVVIQVVQTRKDTLVGYRYLSGGVGGSYFRDFRFLTEEEVSKTVDDWKNIKIHFDPSKSKC
ncbi:MAG: hypothetical protein ACXVC6_04095 [Bacteroidia bacterium]